MAEPTALRLHDNQSFPDQLGYAVHQTAVQTMAHLKKMGWSKTEHSIIFHRVPVRSERSSHECQMHIMRYG
eukprot:scaffold25367_cov54-Attheya_sp.AAC.1